MDMSDLEPDVFFRQGPWRIGNDVLEALLEQSMLAQNIREKSGTYLKTLRILLLLLVYDSEAEVHLVRLFEFRRHAHDLREGLLSMIERTIAIIQYTNAIPQFWLLENAISIEPRDYHQY